MTAPLSRAAQTLAVAVASVTVIGCAGTPDADTRDAPARPVAQIAASTNIRPPDGTESYLSAVKSMRSGDDDAAIAKLETALTRNPAHQMALMTLGELYMKRQSFERAVAPFQTLTRLDPYTPKNFYNLGLSLQVIDRLRESATAYNRALALDGQDFKSNMNLGLVYFALAQSDPAKFDPKMMDAAIVHLERATRIEPGNVRAWSNIGVAYDAAGNAVLAEASYRKALELDPTNEATLTNLTSNLIAQRKANDAVAIAERLVVVSATPVSQKRLGDALTLADRWDEAARAYDAAVALDPTFTPALNAEAEMRITQYEAGLRLDDALRAQAIALWQRSLKVNPDQPTVAKLLAQWEAPKRI